MTALDELHASGRKWQVIYRNGWVARMFDPTPRADGSVRFAFVTPPHRSYAEAVKDLAETWALHQAAADLDATVDQITERLREVLRDTIEVPASLAVQR